MDFIPGCCIPVMVKLVICSFVQLTFVSLSRVTVVLLILPKVKLAFPDASAYCLGGYALLRIITPKSLCLHTRFQYLTPISYENSLSFPCALLNTFPNQKVLSCSVTI